MLGVVRHPMAYIDLGIRLHASMFSRRNSHCCTFPPFCLHAQGQGAAPGELASSEHYLAMSLCAKAVFQTSSAVHWKHDLQRWAEVSAPPGGVGKPVFRGRRRLRAGQSQSACMVAESHRRWYGKHASMLQRQTQLRLAHRSEQADPTPHGQHVRRLPSLCGDRDQQDPSIVASMHVVASLLDCRSLLYFARCRDGRGVSGLEAESVRVDFLSVAQ